MEKVLVFNNEIEAEWMAEILIEEGIPYHIQSYHQAGLNGISSIGRWIGQLKVGPDHKEWVLKAYKDLNEGEFDDGKESE